MGCNIYLDLCITIKQSEICNKYMNPEKTVIPAKAGIQICNLL